MTDLVRVGDGDRDGVGARYEFRVRIGPLRLRSVLEVIEAQEPVRVVVEIESLLDATEVCTFEPDGSGTRVTFDTRVKTPGGPLAPLLDRVFVVPMGRRQTRRELRLIRRNLELSRDGRRPHAPPHPSP